jgi:hypothetical protein
MGNHSSSQSKTTWMKLFSPTPTPTTTMSIQGIKNGYVVSTQNKGQHSKKYRIMYENIKKVVKTRDIGRGKYDFFIKYMVTYTGLDGNEDVIELIVPLDYCADKEEKQKFKKMSEIIESDYQTFLIKNFLTLSDYIFKQ